MNFVTIESLKNTKSGPCALLGGGLSVDMLDLQSIASRMPIIGMTRSWHRLETPWRVFVDGTDWLDLAQTVAPKPELAFFPVPKVAGLRGLSPDIPDLNLCPLNHIAAVPEERRFMGFHLDDGTYGVCSGLVTLEVAAWVGHNPIYLLGYDNMGGHWFEPTLVPTELAFELWSRLMVDAADALEANNVQVVNCSLISTIQVFPFSNEFERGVA